MSRFTAGQRVTLNTDEPYHKYSFGEKTYKNSVWTEINREQVFVIKSLSPDEVGDVKVWPENAESDHEQTYLNIECLSLVDEPDKPTVDSEKIANLIRDYARDLDKAIALKTMIPGVSSTGFLAQFLMEYTQLENK